MVVLASAGGNTVPVIARLVQADEDSVRQAIHRFNTGGVCCTGRGHLRWLGRRYLTDDEGVELGLIY